MTLPLRPNPLAALIRGALLPSALMSLFAASTAAAETYTVTTAVDSPDGTGTSGSLRYAIGASGDGDTIEFSCADLGCPVTLPVHLLGNDGGFPGPTAFSISGKSITIAAPNPGDVTLQAQPAGSTSATSLRLFFVDSDAALTLQNVKLIGGRAIGGNGGAAFRGGGGGAAGLGGAIFSQGSLSLVGVSFVDNGAVGGAALGSSTFGLNYGGGGGLGGDGGAGVSGGGGGTGGDGGSWSIAPDGTRFAGPGGAGLGGAGGGMPGGYRFNSAAQYPVGPASQGGGGAGGYLWNGGHGAEGGGGGSSGAQSFVGINGGNGGFGGGGGGNKGVSPSLQECVASAGSGGFGGGGGSGCSTVPGSPGGGAGGVGGGNGMYYSNQGSPGGGGAAFGGAVFARSGSVSVRSVGTQASIEGNTLVAGAGANNGAAAGRGLFLMSGVPATFEIEGSYTIADDIADDSVASVRNDQGYTPGGGTGAAISKTGAGTLILDGVNTYSGATTIAAGTLRGVGSVSGPVTLASGATIAPGHVDTVGVFATGAFTWNGGGTIRLRLGATAEDGDLLLVRRQLLKGSAGAFRFAFGVGDSPPVVGTVIKLIQSNNANAFAPGNFSFVADPALGNFTGTFSIVDNAVLFTVTGVATGLHFADGFE